MIPVISCLVGQHINLTVGRFTTIMSLSASILSFVNIIFGGWPALSFTITECASKDTSVGALSTSFSFHDYVALF